MPFLLSSLMLYYQETARCIDKRGNGGMRQAERTSATLRNVGIIVIISLAVLFGYVVYQATQFDALSSVEAIDIAQVARNYASGEGFTTNWVRPLTLVVSNSLGQHHELTQAPLQPVVEAGFFTLFGASDRVASWTSGICFLLGVGLTFLLAYRVFNLQTALIAMVLVATDTALLNYSISGLESSLLTMLVTLTFLILYLHHEKEHARWWLSGIAGILAGLIYLTSYVWFVAWIPILLVIWFNSDPKKRLRHAAIFALLSILICLPWFIRNYNLTGNPVFSFRWTEAVMNTYSYSANTLARTYEEAPTGLLSFAIEAPREVYRKMRTGVLNLRSVIANIGGPFVSAFFWVAILVPLGGIAFDRIRKASYALFVLVGLVLVFLGPDPRILVPLAPLVTVTAVGLFLQMLNRRTRDLGSRRQGRWRTIGIGLLVAVHVIPLMFVMVEGLPTYYTEADTLRRATNELDTMLQPEEPVITDVPWVFAWYSDRPAVWLPVRPVDIRRIEEKVGQIDHMALTPGIMQNAEQEKNTDWARTWRRALQEDVTYAGWRVEQRMASVPWVLFRRISE